MMTYKNIFTATYTIDGAEVEVKVDYDDGYIQVKQDPEFIKNYSMRNYEEFDGDLEEFIAFKLAK